MDEKKPPKWAAEFNVGSQKESALYDEAAKVALEMVFIPEGAVKEQFVRIQNLVFPKIILTKGAEEPDVPFQSLWAVQFAEAVLKACGLPARESDMFTRLSYLLLGVNKNKLALEKREET